MPTKLIYDPSEDLLFLSKHSSILLLALVNFLVSLLGRKTQGTVENEENMQFFFRLECTVIQEKTKQADRANQDHISLTKSKSTDLTKIYLT